MAETMIERVARALCAEHLSGQMIHGILDETTVDEHWRGWICAAKQLLNAMRESTEAMAQIGGEKLPGVVDTMGEADEAAGDVWSAMVDAALEEG